MVYEKKIFEVVSSLINFFFDMVIIEEMFLLIFYIKQFYEGNMDGEVELICYVFWKRFLVFEILFEKESEGFVFLVVLEDCGIFEFQEQFNVVESFWKVKEFLLLNRIQGGDEFEMEFYIDIFYEEKFILDFLGEV